MTVTRASDSRAIGCTTGVRWVSVCATPKDIVRNRPDTALCVRRQLRRHTTSSLHCHRHNSYHYHHIIICRYHILPSSFLQSSLSLLPLPASISHHLRFCLCVISDKFSLPSILSPFHGS